MDNYSSIVGNSTWKRGRLAGAVAVLSLLIGTSAKADAHQEINLGAPSSDWSGPYLGANIAGAFSTGQAERTLATGFVVETDVRNGLFPDSIGDGQGSLFGGVSLGYNIQQGDLVSSIEISISAMAQQNELRFSRVDPEILVGVDTITEYQTDIDNLATASVRTGRVVDDMLLFARVGIARAEVTNHFSLDLTGANIPRFDFAEEGTRLGYIFGIGVERRLTDRVSLVGEMSYYNLEDVTVEARAPSVFPGNELDYTFKNDGLTASIGINISF